MHVYIICMYIGGRVEGGEARGRVGQRGGGGRGRGGVGGAGARAKILKSTPCSEFL